MNNNVTLINAQKSFTGLNLTSFTCLYSNYTLNYTLNYILNYTLDYTISSLRYCYTLNCLCLLRLLEKFLPWGEKIITAIKKNLISGKNILSTSKRFSQQTKNSHNKQNIFTALKKLSQ